MAANRILLVEDDHAIADAVALNLRTVGYEVVTFDDGSEDTGWIFCMYYDPDDVSPLQFMFLPDPDRDDIDVEPESLPLPVLKNITAWIESQFNHQKQ